MRLNGERATEADLGFTLRFIDSGESFDVMVENAVLRHHTGATYPVVELTRAKLVDLVLGEAMIEDLIKRGEVTGEATGELGALIGLLDRFDFWFEIVAP